jgi:hypothetical protein
VAGVVPERNAPLFWRNLCRSASPRASSGEGEMRLPSALKAKSNRRSRPGARKLRREIMGELRSRFTGQQLAHAIGEGAPFFLDQTARRCRHRVRLLLVKLRGPAFENDLLLVGAAQRQPPQPDARQDDGEEKYPDTPFHEARRRLSTLSPAEQQSAHRGLWTRREGRAVPHAAHRAAATEINQRVFWYLSA